MGEGRGVESVGGVGDAGGESMSRRESKKGGWVERDVTAKRRLGSRLDYNNTNEPTLQLRQLCKLTF